MYITNNKIIDMIDEKRKLLLFYNPNQFVLDIDYINDILDTVYNNSLTNKNSYIIDKINLYIILFSHLSLACDELKIFNNNFIEKSDKLNILMKSLFCNYSNDILSILNLVTNGFDYQASILMRSTVELSFLIISLIFEPSKLDLYYNLSENYNHKIWVDNFSFKSLNKLIEKCEKPIYQNDTKFRNEIKSWRKKIYTFYSGHTHNSLLSSLIFSYSYPKNDKIGLNLFGTFITRIDEILEELDFTLFYTMLIIFYNLQYNYKYLPEYKNTTWITLSQLYLVLKDLTIDKSIKSPSY